MREWLRRLGHMLQRRRFEGDLAEELEFHRAMARQTLEADGVDPVDAGFAARRAFGSGAFAQDQARDVWVPRCLQGLGQDLRLAVRMLWSARLVSAIAILSLALGIGANTAIFALADSLLLRALPVDDPARLAVIVEPRTDGVPAHERYAVWEEIRQHPQIFAGTLAWSTTLFNLAAHGEVQAVEGIWASGSFFEVLGVPAVAGRTLAASDDASLPQGANAEPAAVISYAFWQSRYAGAADAIGRSLTLDGAPFTIVGVTPPGFFGPEVGRTFDVIVPLGAEPRVHGRESWIAPDSLAGPLTVMIRVKPEQSLSATVAALRGIQPQIRAATMPASWPAQFRGSYLSDPFVLAPIASVRASLRRRYERPLLTLMVIAALVLLIACGNIANLLLARVTARRHEMRVRRALGASRWRLARQLATEGLVLAALAAAFAAVLASWASRVLVRALSTDANPVFLDLALNLHVVVFTAGVALVSVLLFAVLPALREANTAPAYGRPLDGRALDARSYLSSGLIIVQVALSLVLVTSAGLFVRTLASLSRRDLGFDSHHVLLVSISTRRTSVSPAQRAALYERVRDAVKGTPGVRSAAASLLGPVSEADGPMLAQPIASVSGGRPLPPHGTISFLNLISAGWFGTLGTPIVEGRDVSDADERHTAPVAVVNEAFVRTFLDGADPIGRAVTLYMPGPPPPPVTIVGVAADAVYGSLRRPVTATIYLPMAQLPDVALPFLESSRLVVRSSGEPPENLIKRVSSTISTVNPDLALMFRTLDDQIDASLLQERLLAALSGFFGALALLLAALGLYGVTAYAVIRRRAEIGIRVALGAAPRGVVQLVLSRVALVVGLGIIAGAGLSLWASRFIASLLYGLPPRDPATLVGASLVLAAVAALAAWLPARHASRVDPAAVLRSE